MIYNPTEYQTELIMYKKPVKKNDNVLYTLVESKILAGDYIFLKHAKDRQNERQISDLDVLNILEGKAGFNRKRNKAKDHHEEGREDWNYCIEGVDFDKNSIRIIISFMDSLMPIITVMRIKE